MLFVSCADYTVFLVKQDGTSNIVTKKSEVVPTAAPIMEASAATAEKATAKPIEPPSAEKPVEVAAPVASNPIPNPPPKPEPAAAEAKKAEDNIPAPAQPVAESKPAVLPTAGTSPESSKVKASPGKDKTSPLAKTKTSVGEQKPISSLPPVKKTRTKLEMDINIAPSKHAAKDNTASSIEKPSTGNSKVSEEGEEEVSAKWV